MTPEEAVDTSEMTLVFEDDFDGTDLDTSSWNYRTDVKSKSAQLPGNVSVADGRLAIAQKQESHSGQAYTGGGVISKEKFRYGYYEARMRTNDGPGWHTSFWLMAGDGSTSFPPEARTEIDIVEIDSISPTTLQHNVHCWKTGGVMAPVQYASGRYDIGSDLRQWHTYGVDWSETRVRYYVDGVLRYTAPYTPDDWTHDHVNIWLTSIAHRVEPDVTKLPTSVQFEYVRHWRRDDAG